MSEKGADGLLNIPVKDMELWVEELGGGGVAVNVGDPDDAELVEVQLQHFDLQYRFTKVENVREVIIRRRCPCRGAQTVERR